MGGKQIMETFWLLATFMNHDGAWIKGREDTQITTSCSGRTLLSREKRHDYFKHSLPSGLWERKETLSSSCWMSLKFSSPRQIFKTHKIIPVDSLRVFISMSAFELSLPLSPVSGSGWPRHILESRDHLCCPQLPSHSNEIITMFVQCRPDQ